MRLLAVLLLLCSPLYSQVTILPCADHSCLEINNVICPVDRSEIVVKVLREDESGIPILGRVTQREDGFIFYPRFSFRPGIQYSVELSDCGERSIHNFRLSALKKAKPNTFVTGVYPSSYELPVNQLKLYVLFSDSMKEGIAFDHIKLFTADGKPEPDAFIQMGEELWDKERKRLTLFFDPGRIKKGVGPNELLGLPLRTGESYRLVISKEMLNAEAITLTNSFVKEFKVVVADRTKPAISKWEIEAPPAHSKEHFTIQFGESMDYALLKRLIKIVGPYGTKIKGIVTIGSDEASWHFTPGSPWKQEKYEVKINTWLEDLAGNNLTRLFDLDLTKTRHDYQDYGEEVIEFYPKGDLNESETK